MRPSRRNSFIGALLALALIVDARAADPKPGDSKGVIPDAIKRLLEARDYPAALKALDADAPTPALAEDFRTYLKGRILHLSGKYDAAVEAYLIVEQKFPKSEWSPLARFARAVSLARKGDFRGAEGIYREQAVALLSGDRKQQVADIYLEFADAYFKPKDEQQAPNYAKAREFYEKALEVGPKADRRREVELRVAECFQKEGNVQEAAARFAKFVKDYARPGAATDLEIEARYRLGECQLALNQPEDARRTWQDLLAAAPDSKHDRLPEAAFNLSLTWKLPQPANDDDLGLGVASLEAFLKRWPSHKLASQAYLRIATSQGNRGRYDDAVKTLTTFLADNRYAASEEAPEARVLLGKAYQLQKKFPDALTAWRDYLTKHPAHKSWSAVQNEIVNTEFLVGREALEAKKYDEARRVWNEFLVRYPLDGRQPAILFQFGRIDYVQDKFDDAIAAWRRLVSKYPETNESSQAQFMIAATLEEKSGKLEDALKEYRKLTWGSFAQQAQQRIARLSAKSLTIATERTFRTNEKPTVKLVSRNIESVQVRVYTVDMETYFRKMHIAGGVEGLDISLIDPDQSFEFKLPKYAEHQQFENDIEIPLPSKSPDGPGVMAVTVSSKTLEATTLVMRSNLDVIVKSSRDEVFVFAENMLTGKPWPKVRLLVSNGQQVFAEAATGDDGVFKSDYKELREAGNVRVFAIVDGHVASNIVDLSGVAVAQGLTDKGYLYTDRPAYRAGQIVHVRGVVRLAKNDAFTFDKGAKFTLEVFDPRSRLVQQENVALGEFGSFHAHFTLPPASALGQYRLQLRDDDKRNFQGTFTVHDYQLEPVRLAVDASRKVYYRGEEIEGKITARFYYGAPLADREIRYQLADGRVLTGRTDAKGELSFKFPTREYRETQVLSLVATLAERNLQASTNFLLATKGFSIGLSTVRSVYVAGETFEATLRTSDAEGKPSGEKLTLGIYEQTTVDGKVGERKVESRDVATDAKTGAARTTLRLERGARYTLRAEGTDRFGNPISGEHVVQVSDDEDAVRLRILADRHTFKVGDTASVNVHWREAPALALVTFQGARVLDYRLVQLQTGANAIPIPMDAKLAPNFDLSVAVMTDARRPKDDKQAATFRRFHEAASPFTVERDLRVTLVTKRADGKAGPVRPGEDVTVTLRAVDPQGKPVNAELSLAMIDQALHERFGANVEAIQEFFKGVPRTAAVRTTSSVVFAYQPTTRPINTRLLAEKDRRELAEEEATRLAGMITDLAGTMSPTSWATVDNLAAADDAPTQPGKPQSNARFHGINGPWDRNEDTDGEMGGDQATNNLFGNFASGTVAFDAPDGTVITKQLMKADQAARHREQLNSLKRKLSESELRRRGLTRNQAALGGRVGLGYGLAEEKGMADFSSNLGLIVDQTQLGVTPRIMVQESEEALIGRGYGELDYRSLSRLRMTVSNGQQRNIRLGDLDSDAIALLEKEVLAEGGTILPIVDLQETAYWNAAVVTDAKGEATVTFTVPERSTAWKLLAKGITTDTLAGEAETELTVKKDLFGEMKLPLAFTDGDTAEIAVTVHNDAVEKAPIEVTLKTTIGDKSTEEKKTITPQAKGQHELAFNGALNRAASAAASGDELVTFELTVASGETKDTVRRALPLRPYGMPVFATAGGSATSDTTVWVEAPTGMNLVSPKLEILVGPTVERSLLDVVLAPARACQIDVYRLASGLDVSTSDLIASLALQKLMGKAREATGPEAASLDARTRGSVGSLVAAQNDDGGWSWTGRGGASDRFASARAVWALSLARKAGYAVADDTRDKALKFLQSALVASSDSDYETKAILAHALATAGQGDFTLANRLYRNRPALSNAALAYLALAFVEMDRHPTAGELLDLLATRNLDGPIDRRSSTASLPWSGSGTEVRALYAIAMEQVSPGSPKTKELVDWLLAHRTGHRWSPEKATGPATWALAQWFGKTKVESEHYKLTVFVNDNQAQVLDIVAGAGTQMIEVPAKLLNESKQRVNFQLTGRGRFTFQCVLAGFVPAEKLKSTTTAWRVNRIFEPALRELDGQPIPRGFGVVQGGYNSFHNPLTELPVGKQGSVTLEVWRQNLTNDTRDEQLPYLVVTEPLPSGATVIESSVRGGFERYEIAPGAITFYIGNRRGIEYIHYDLHGYLPGAYRAAPTVVRAAYAPEQMAVSEVKSLAVLPLGAPTSDAYRHSPQELFELGKRHFAKAEHKASGEFLTELLGKWNVKPEVYLESVKMLLDVHLALGPAHEIVRYFELVKEKSPELEISFEKIVKVGAAYDEIGEYERSYLVFRATVESSFNRESSVAGFLEAQGEFLRSVDVMTRFLREYPPEPYIAAAQYALAQRVYAYAPQAATDPKLREKKINRVDLVSRALGMLDNFLAEYPEDPAADQAAFSLANALLELKQFKAAIARCQRYADLYPESDFRDSFWYVIGYSHFALSEHDAALAMCRKVAEAQRTDKQSGRTVESKNKWLAVYILGQVHHSLGQAAEAIREYTRVSDRFPDAKQAIDYFLHKGINLPEVTTVRPGDAAGLDLKFRNVARCDAKVYRIDLMKFSLLNRNLAGITQINLAGIRPYHEAVVELGNGKDYKDRTHKLPLPLKEEGAYLVVCRGDDLYASGLVLVTPLAVDVQEEATSGQVRVTVKDAKADKYKSDVHVKVIGARNEDFIAGESDLRGVFTAEGIRGTSTVIAQAEGNRYAFYRGQLPLGPAEAEKDAKGAESRSGEKGEAAAVSATPAMPQGGSQPLLEFLQRDNGVLQQMQCDQLKQLYDHCPTGVQAKEAF